MREHERSHTVGVDRLAVVSAIQTIPRQAHLNAPTTAPRRMVTHLSCTGVEPERIGAVLDEFEELPVLIAAVRRVLLCQGPVGSAQWRTVELPVRGHQNCPVVAGCSARRSVGQWRHPLAGGGLGEADAVAGGHDDVGVVEQPVDGGVGDGLGHEFVESGGVKVAGQGDGAFLVGGVDDAVERLGGLGCDRE